MKNLSRLAILPLLFSAAVFATEEKPDRGWHWYEMFSPEQREAIEKVVEYEVERKVTEALKEMQKAEQPPAGSSEWIKQNLPKFRNAAADNPTAENVRALLILERVMFDRASNLGRRAQMIAQSDPLLESGHSSTSNVPQARARRAAADDNKDLLIEQMTNPDEVVLWSFIQPDCSECTMQVESFSLLTRNLGIPVLFILMDGAEAPAYPYEENAGLWESVEDTGQSKLFPLISMPTTYAFHSRTSEYVLLSQGHMPITPFKDRLITAADFAGWLTPEQVESTRFNPNKVNFNAIKFDTAEKDLTDPAAFLEHVESQLMEDLK